MGAGIDEYDRREDHADLRHHKEDARAHGRQPHQYIAQRKRHYRQQTHLDQIKYTVALDAFAQASKLRTETSVKVIAKEKPSRQKGKRSPDYGCE